MEIFRLLVGGGRARRIGVKIGLMNDFEVEITSGLQADERVILALESSLTTGQRVEPQEVE